MSKGELYEHDDLMKALTAQHRHLHQVILDCYSVGDLPALIEMSIRLARLIGTHGGVTCDG